MQRQLKLCTDPRKVIILNSGALGSKWSEVGSARHGIGLGPAQADKDGSFLMWASAWLPAHRATLNPSGTQPVWRT